LPDSMREVMQGESPRSPGIARMIIYSMQHASKPAAKDYNLSNREQEILAILSRGNGFKQIAAELFISVDTVRTHIKKIYEKLQVHSQTEAVSKVLNKRLF
jgi:DNA-binding NarL/FixJ family response regulator